MDDIKSYNKVFSENDCKLIYDRMESHNWYFGHGSRIVNNRLVGTPFWRMDLKDDEFFNKYLLNMIEEKTQQHYELYDVYANGHTFGTQGEFHVDWYEPNGRTLLYYANSNWRPEWGGKTIFLRNENELEYKNPIPNSAILFPGEIPHMAEGTSRLFTGLRVTVAWKLILK